MRWLAEIRVQYPDGFVPIPTAARILAVSPKRIHALVDEGRFTVISGMPGGNERDRFIPIIELHDAPFAMTRGRPGVFGPKNRYTGKKKKSRDDWANSNISKHLRGD